MSTGDDNILPICYRCDSKYITFLNNSIRSVLQYYKGSRKIQCYICTNDTIDTSALTELHSNYNFDYEIIRIDSDFLTVNNLSSDLTKTVYRKFCGFNNSVIRTDSSFCFNPFSRSKTVAMLGLFFLATTTYEKVLCLDTDTIIISDIDELYNMDVSGVYLSSCRDWDTTETGTTFNPSVALINIERFQQTVFQELMPFFTKCADSTTFTDKLPLFEVLQKAICDIVGDEWLELAPEWNMPITLINESHQPKIIHFAESWSNNAIVVGEYSKIVAKYLHNAVPS